MVFFGALTLQHTQKLPTKTQQFTAYNAQPWICQLLFGHHLRYGKPVIPWSSIFSVARQQASLSYFIKVSQPSPGAKVAIRYCLFRFSPLMFPNPKELHMLNVNDVFFLEKWKNIWISQELHIHHCGFDWILRGIVYLGSFFLKMPCLLWTKSRKGQAMTLVKHGWIRQMFIWVATLSAHVPGLLRTAFQRPLQVDVSETLESFDLFLGVEVHQRIPSETRGLKSGHATKKSENQFKAHQWIIEVLVMYDISLYDLLQSVVVVVVVVVVCPTCRSVHIEWTCCACTACTRYASCSKTTPKLPWPWFM